MLLKSLALSSLVGLSFSPGQLPNFQGKSPGIFPSITPMVGTF